MAYGERECVVGESLSGAETTLSDAGDAERDHPRVWGGGVSSFDGAGDAGGSYESKYYALLERYCFSVGVHNDVLRAVVEWQLRGGVACGVCRRDSPTLYDGAGGGGFSAPTAFVGESAGGGSSTDGGNAQQPRHVGCMGSAGRVAALVGGQVVDGTGAVPSTFVVSSGAGECASDAGGTSDAKTILEFEESGCGDVHKPVGKWQKKNRAARERKKKKVVFARGGSPVNCEVHEVLSNETSKEELSVRSGESTEVERGEIAQGYFSACSNAVRRELRETRALRYIEENKLRAAKAAADTQRLTLERKTRLNESRFELQRQRVEVQLNNLREKRLGGVTTGWVESVIGSLDETGTSTPSLSVGSVSPSSSMSVEQEKKLRGALDQMATRVKELEAKLSALSTVKMSAADKEIAAYESCYEKGDFSLQGATSDSIDLRYDGFGYD